MARIGKWFPIPYDTVVDKIDDALNVAQVVGVDLTDIYMMLNDSCNSWGEYMCQAAPESGYRVYYNYTNNTDENKTAPRVCKEQPELTSDEYNFIKNELLNETLKMVDELYSDLNYDYDEETAEMIRKEMIRGIILYTGITPDQIELNKVKTNQLPDKKWQTYLKLCC